MARPTKYTKELIELAEQYLENYEKYDHAFPSDIGLADVLGIATSTLHTWNKEEGKEQFSNILDKINTKQQLVAWNKGLKGEYNANLVKLLLGKHGFSEKSELTGNNGGPLTIRRAGDLTDEELAAIAAGSGKGTTKA